MTSESRPQTHGWWDRLIGRHDWQFVDHWGRGLWCEVKYECSICGERREVHEDHWQDRHEEKGWTG